ncbi:MAG: YnbE family lipoprotein [Chlorobiaceae bacterium]|nr:YnbE family lipoprotein [Chlorobiaceae bacterium]
MNKRSVAALKISAVAAFITTAGCSPTVKLEAPEKPIVINMNIKIDHEIRVKLDRDIENMLETRKDIF